MSEPDPMMQILKPCNMNKKTLKNVTGNSDNCNQAFVFWVDNYDGHTTPRRVSTSILCCNNCLQKSRKSMRYNCGDNLGFYNLDQEGGLQPICKRTEILSKNSKKHQALKMAGVPADKKRPTHSSLLCVSCGKHTAQISNGCARS